MTALITLSHGSRHPGAAVGIERLTQAAAAAIPAHPAYRAAHLEFNTPDLTSAALDLARCGKDSAVVIPLLFTQGYHQRVDVPRVIAAAEEASGLRLVQGECLGGGRAARDADRREAGKRNWRRYSPRAPGLEIPTTSSTPLVPPMLRPMTPSAGSPLGYPSLPVYPPRPRSPPGVAATAFMHWQGALRECGLSRSL